MAEKKYRLYAGAYTKGDFEYSFCGAYSQYMLVYSVEKPTTGEFTEIPLEKQKNLKIDEKEWLYKCKLKINAEHIKSNSANYLNLLNDFLNELEKNLKEVSENGKTE